MGAKNIAVISTPAGSHICSSGSCGGKALAEFLQRNEMEQTKTVTARTNTPYTPQGQIKNLPLRIVIEYFVLKIFLYEVITHLFESLQRKYNLPQMFFLYEIF